MTSQIIERILTCERNFEFGGHFVVVTAKHLLKRKHEMNIGFIELMFLKRNAMTRQIIERIQTFGRDFELGGNFVVGTAKHLLKR